MTELALNFLYSGGVYIFPFKTIGGNIGRFLAWIACWGFLLFNIAAVAFSAIYIGHFLSICFNWAEHYISLIAIISIVFVMFINCISIEKAKRIDNICVIVLVIVAFVYVWNCFSSESFSINNLLFFFFFTQEYGGKFGFISMIPTALVGYGSAISIAFMASDIKNPKRNIPLACIISMIVVFLIYAFLTFATMGIITSKYLADNPDFQYIAFFVVCFDFKILHLFLLSYA